MQCAASRCTGDGQRKRPQERAERREERVKQQFVTELGVEEESEGRRKSAGERSPGSLSLPRVVCNFCLLQNVQWKVGQVIFHKECYQQVQENQRETGVACTKKAMLIQSKEC